MGTLIPPLPSPHSHSKDGGQMTQPLWTNVSTVLTKNELFGFNFSKGANKHSRVWMPVILRQGGGGGEVWIKNGTSRNYGTPVMSVSSYHLYGKPMERFILVEIIRKKSNTFRGINFFPFLPKRLKFSVPFVWITSARLHVERK